MSSKLDIWKKILGANVVIDTNSPYLYLGKLIEVDEWFVTLTDVDVHDQREGSATKERYVIEAKKHGIRASRKSVVIRQEHIISFSKLDDVVEY